MRQKTKTAQASFPQMLASFSIPASSQTHATANRSTSFNTLTLHHNKNIWVQTGYKLFADKGPHGLKVEVLAKQVGISKSSFYHHFADVEVFTTYLLQHHLDQTRLMAEQERQCEKIDPHLISVLVEHKTDLLFNRQLRVERQNPVFQQCLSQSNAIAGHSFIEVWTRDLQLKLAPHLMQGIFELALENFYLQITPDTLNQAWLSAYFKNLARIVASFRVA